MPTLLAIIKYDLYLSHKSTYTKVVFERTKQQQINDQWINTILTHHIDTCFVFFTNHNSCCLSLFEKYDVVVVTFVLDLPKTTIIYLPYSCLTNIHACGSVYRHLYFFQGWRATYIRRQLIWQREISP